ncbi:molybdopterin-dependent oxidoreductase [Thermodesulfobacteriota bacterium]
MSDRGETEVIRTICGSRDANVCGLNAHVRDGVLVKVEPADFPEQGYRHICARALSATRFVYHPDRLTHPLKRVGERGEGKWQRISWDEALDTIAAKLNGIGERYGTESVAFATTGIGTLSGVTYTRFTSAFQGSWVRLIGYGDAAGPCGDSVSYGTLWGENYTIDFDDPEVCVVWGHNVAVTTPSKWRRIQAAKDKGGKLVVIDPLFTTTASKADQHLPIRPGTDVALILGMINLIIDQNLYNGAFVSDHTVGPFLVREDNGLFLREKDLGSGDSERYLVWDSKTDEVRAYDDQGVTPSLKGIYNVAGISCKPAFQLLRELAAQYPLEKAAEITELDADAIRDLAVSYATCKPVSSFRGWGLQRTFHGDLTYRAISMLAGITGNINLDNPSRAFVLNMRSMALVPGRRFKRLSLLDLYDTIMTAKPYPIKALWIAMNNFVNQNPDMNKITKELLPKMEFIVVVDFFMNASAQYADIVLPACSCYEYDDLHPPGEPSYMPYLQLQQKVIEPIVECKPDFEIMKGLAKRMGFGEFFDKRAEDYLEVLLQSGHPSMEGVTLEKLRQGPFTMPSHSTPLFSTPSGRLEFYSERLRELGQELPLFMEPLESKRRPLAAKYPLSFFTTHTKYRTHSMFANVDWLNELDPEPNLAMNPADAEKRGISDGDRVVVFNDRGMVKVKARVHTGIREGIVNITQGWWTNQFAGGSHQALTHGTINPAQKLIFDPNTALYDVLVEVKKEEDG